MQPRETLNFSGNELVIGGLKASALAAEFKTPLIVYDEDYINKVCTAFTSTLKNHYGSGAVAYASKAFSCIKMAQIIASHNMHIDTVSVGEMVIALKGGIKPANIIFHGNNKTEEELNFAVLNNIGLIVIDSEDEAEILNSIALEHGKVVDVLIRINPAVEAHTHEFVRTAVPDSKFGFSFVNAVYEIEKILMLKNLNFLGLHSHIGSQIFEKSAFIKAADIITDFIKQNNLKIKVLNLGGGFGVNYTPADPVFDVDDYADYVKVLCEGLNSFCKEKNIEKPFLIIEPGRSVVCEAGVTLYTVGAIKNTPAKVKYYAVDGGMCDNPRFALYGSKYSFEIANKVSEPKTEVVSVTGKCCESGDMLGKNIKLQKAERGDILAVFNTGAYNYSMSSNYNGNFRPAVVFVCNKKAEVAIRRENAEDLLKTNFLL